MKIPTSFSRRSLALALVISIIFPVVSLSAANAGQSCNKAGASAKSKSGRKTTTKNRRKVTTLVCKKTGRKLVWVAKKKTTATPTITQLAVTIPAAGAASGAAFTTQPQVTIQDAGGNTVTSSSAVVIATISAGGSLVGTTTTTAVNGVATFTNLGITVVAGTTYTITYSIGGLAIATQSVTASVGAASRLALTRLSVGLASGAAFTTQPQVTIQDAGGNTVTSSSAVVTATISAGGSLVGTTTTTAVNGVATFTNLGSAGVAGTAYTIIYTSGGLTVATQVVTVSAGAVGRLALTRLSVGVASGAAFAVQPQVTIQDAGGNTVTSSSAVVIATISAGGTLVGSTTATAVNGVATFTNLGSAGVAGTAYTITYYTISHLPNYLTTVTQVVNASVGAATRLAVIRASAGTASDAAFTTQPQVVLQDAGGNTVTSSSAVITAAVTAVGGDTVTGTLTATAANGIATFSNLKIKGTIGSRTITYTSGSLTSATETFTLTFGAATQLAVSRSSAGAASDAAFTTQPQITVRDSAGNTVTNYTPSVTAAVTAVGGDTVTGTLTVAPTTDTGVVTYSGLKIKGTIGSRTITYTSGSLTSATETFTLTHGVATNLLLSTQAAGAVTNVNFTTQPVVTVRDSANNTVTTGGGSTVTVTFASSGGTPSGNSVSAVGGVATFTAGKIVTAGTYTITYSSGSLTTATQSLTVAA